ncbi:hypothetical protein [Acinetobacter ursingii]|uniref:hypothetical protein n=1 Tax=Acinetobacter ursingii TaxID=108980 RepID=UPI000CB71EE4|nr:hypothetical protein [Acinetobacter ursingii]MCU4350076.1 hypothetical protein [Acinetobacter ursingii]MDI3239805.1 hypothetical protein [Acinetobacter ursingii]PMC97134.1 hypothetical protein CJ183_08670 [Acinetobacter ursingii]
MKFSFVDLNGHTVTGDCEFIDHPAQSISHALATEIKNSTALDGVLGEFSFYQKSHAENESEVSRFAVDNENNVFHSDKLPDFVQIGSHWKSDNS